MGASRNWTLAMQYRSLRSAFSAAMVQARKVRYVKIILLAWRMVFGIVRVQEGAVVSILLKDLTRDPRRAGQVACHYGNELAKLIPFRLICNNAMIVAALSEIFHKRWGAKKDGLYLSQ